MTSPVPVRYAVRSLVRRRGTALLCVAVFAAEALMLLACLGLLRGMRGFMRSAADPANLIVLERAVGMLEHSRVPAAAADALAALPGTVVSPELVFGDLATAPDGTTSVPVRGVGPAAEAVRRVRWLAGALPTHDREVALGDAVAKATGLDVGGTLAVDGTPYRVVGRFAASPLYEAEAWAALRGLQRDTGNEGLLSGLVVRGTTVDAALATLRADPRLAELDVRSEVDYFKSQAHQARLFALLALVFGATLGLGVLFGSANTMRLFVEARRAELATLRALGFARHALFAATLLQITLLGLAGAAVGAVGALGLAFVPVTQLTPGFRTVTIAVAVGPGEVAVVTLVTLSLASIAGLVPAVRASRVAVAEVLSHAT